MPPRYRSLFWPAVLILAGLIALFVNTGIVSGDRLILLLYLWPVILIVIGLELIVRRTVHGPTGDLAAALIVIVAIAGAAGYVALAPNPYATHSHDWSDSAGNLEKAALELDAGDATVTISGSSDLGGDLYRAHIDYSGGPQPQVTLDRASATLKISQSNGFLGQKFVVALQLDAGVPWAITVNSASTTSTLDLAGIHVSSISLNTASAHDEITLGSPSGVIPVRIDGAAMTVHVHRPPGTSFSVDVSGGAVSLDADGHHFGAIGKVDYQTGDQGTDTYRIQVNGGACTVTVDTSGGSD